ENRPDWVLSRQRAWGVPLTCFMRRKIAGGVETVEVLKDAAVNARIAEAIAAEGADAWFEEGAAARFLAGRDDADAWEKVEDILDVWFDSGSTHAFVMEERADGMWPASIYLEGTDQHRGWFHSSLLEGCGTRGRAPYDCVLTHGFALDEKGQKMSKALGNGVAPQDVIKQYGADVLRLWVVTSDYTEDVRIGPEILKNVADSYRRLRNTLRFALGALDGYDPEAEAVDLEAEAPELERWVLHRLAELDDAMRRGYRDFEYSKAFGALFNFCTTDLSAFYFDIRKDALYCDAPDSARRRACRKVMALLVERLAIWLAPMLPFTAEDVWLARHPEAAAEGGESRDDASVHLQTFPETPQRWRDPALAARWEAVRRARRVVNGALEIERREKRIGSSLEAGPIVHLDDPEIRAALEGLDFAEICIASQLTLREGPGPEDAFRLGDVAGVAVSPAPAEGTKCARCWRVLPEVGLQSRPDVCARCDAALAGM
ncbi:MAG: class I tRNA ligase family protein, partial [Pseudomonadota bacterium]